MLPAEKRKDVTLRWRPFLLVAPRDWESWGPEGASQGVIAPPQRVIARRGPAQSATKAPREAPTDAPPTAAAAAAALTAGVDKRAYYDKRFGKDAWKARAAPRALLPPRNDAQLPCCVLLATTPRPV